MASSSYWINIMDKWKIKTLRVKVERHDYDIREDYIGNENSVQKAIENYKNTNDYKYDLLKKWCIDLV